ncbi:hypothetical protein AJ79_07667 [Helicocarpus griseus UAMH5409]|uniref:Uncharacterized protein n=1 Tax=Helicocarpus griseus UAMH5409 TaxID=1447875 RepID=A0A2B7X0I6_9EURO|nr:hypothetical protein AJ79_07667 [Helicocarpus griseus UAMH5409]
MATAQQTPAADPEPPALTFLYTAFVDCEGMYDVGDGPKGKRRVIPIVGGNFTGPRVKGTISNLGADWGLTDARGTFSSDTRYHLETDDGAHIYIQTSGPAQPDGGTHLRLLFETGAEKYAWMNDIVSVGVLKLAGGSLGGGFTLRIDAWHVSLG